MQNPAAIRAILSASCVIGATAISSEAMAQALPRAIPAPSISTQLPAQLPAETVETTTAADGLETITRTRRIPARATPAQVQVQPAQPQYAAPPPSGGAYPTYPVAAYPVATTPAQVVVGREQWINECRRRTAGRSDSDRGKILGGLLGAAVGGLSGNRIASGERLGGTLIGAGAGGAAGAAIGNALDKRDENAGYDCEGALNDYLQQYSADGGRIAARTIPASTPYPAYAPQGYAPYQVYGYQQPSQVVWVPIEVEQPQRVIVREVVREEGLPATRRVRVPTNSKLIRE
ncbi:MAG: glycine zipper domain-containing protein [Pseudomonadota bacterium]